MRRRPSPRRLHPTRLTPAAGALAVLLALPALAGCDGDPTAPGPGAGGDVDGWAVVPGTGGSGGAAGPGSGPTASPVVGRWWRFITFSSGGATRTSETFWDFNPDGSAQRRLVTTNLSDGLVETLVRNARWRTVGTEIEIAYLTPADTVRFRWRVEREFDGEVLYLDETRFERLP